VIGAVWSTTIPARFSTIGGALEANEGEAQVIESIDTLMARVEEVTNTEEPQNTNEGIPETSAFDSLTNWQETAPKQEGSNGDVVPKEEPLPSIPATPSMSATTTGDSEELFIPPPKPHVILIGTTTKKTE
jgi:hypothetical protein